MFVCVWFKVSSLTPVTSAPSGLFFPLLPSLSVAHSLAALTRLLTFRASWEMPLPLTSCCKDPPCSLLTLPGSGSCVMPKDLPAHSPSLCLCVFLPTECGLREGRGLSDPA